MKKLILILGVLSLVACATYQTKVAGSRDSIRAGKIDSALETLKPLAEKPGDDQLVYLLDYAMALQIAGNFKESSENFMRADKLADMKDYHSVTNIALATVGSEEMIQYKGESYEKVLINSFLAINFLMEGKLDDAMVEVRRVIEKINKIRLDGRKDYEQNPFAHYLAGLIWESERKFDDAYISFVDSYKLDKSNPLLGMDLIRGAKLARRNEDYQKWKKEFPNVVEEDRWYDKNSGEVVVLFQQGWGPVKRFSAADRRFPELIPAYSDTTAAEVTIQGQNPKRTQNVYDVERVAMKTLHDDYAWMAARKIGAFAAKAVVADQIRQKNEALGLLAWVTMQVSDRADLRQWSTLPKTMQMARFWLKPGVYKMNVTGLNSSGGRTADEWQDIQVKVLPGRKTFINFRSVH